MIYKVKNLKEGSRDGNWLQYWEEATGLKANLCKNLFCNEKATDGSHVQLANSTNRKWYIIPLCHRCNCHFGEELTVIGPLVSVTDPQDILW